MGASDSNPSWVPCSANIFAREEKNMARQACLRKVTQKWGRAYGAGHRRSARRGDRRQARPHTRGERERPQRDPARPHRGGRLKDHCRTIVRRCSGVTERSDYVAQHT